MHRAACSRLMVVALLMSTLLGVSAEPPTAISNVNELPSDLIVPSVTNDAPQAGRRFRQANRGYETWNLHHVVYLPTDWKPGRKYPVIVEYPGNGGYQNQLGDVSTGQVEDCKLGYGISGGQGFIWVCLPFVDPVMRRHTTKWWGNADATATYCRQAVSLVCEQFGGDPSALILAGFSRGAIAGNYIGLRDDQTARLWRAMILHSHYDGIRRWGYPDDDERAARQRLSRFAGRPQFLSHELSIADTQTFLKGEKVRATFVALPFPNHTDQWVLKDLPARQQLREWLAAVLKSPDLAPAADPGVPK